MAVIKRYNGTTLQWEAIAVGPPGPQGPSGVAGSLDDLDNVTAPSPSTNDILKYNGSAWVNSTSLSVTDVTVTGSSGLFLKTDSGSAGFKLLDRAAAPGRQFVFEGQIAANTSGAQALVNVWQNGQTRAHSNNTTISGLALWAHDAEVETTCAQMGYAAVWQSSTGSGTGKLAFITENYGSAPSTVARMPIEFNAGNEASPQLRLEPGAKIGFFGTPPVVKPSAFVDVSGSSAMSDMATAVNGIMDALEALGLITNTA